MLFRSDAEKVTKWIGWNEMYLFVPSCQVNAKLFIEGTPVNCLLDTTIPLYFYQDHLSSHPLKSLESLLEVEGANGQSVPYLGYLELTLRFPKEFLGVKAGATTLALVVPDLMPVPQVLVGTNQKTSIQSSMHIEKYSKFWMLDISK